MVINLYPYEGIDFKGDIDLLALVGEPWGSTGMYMLSQCIFIF